MIRILHAADLHLDSPFEGLPEEKAALRRNEQRQLLRALAQLRAESGVQLVLLAGDLFDSAASWAGTEDTLRLALAEMEVPVFISPGNHDFYSRSGRWQRLALPENVRLFTGRSLEGLDVPELGVRVWGAAFTDRVSGPLLRGFSAPRQEGRLELLCLHGEVGVPSSRYDPVSEEELAASGLDYAAFGHVHAFSGLRRAGDCFYAWPGCPEGRGFDETGEKGVIIADVERGGVKLRFAPVCTRRYERLEVDASELESFRLPEGAERNIYRLSVTGETDAPPDLAALRRRLEGECFGLRLRGVGLNEKAIQSAGVSVTKYKWASLIITGVLAGAAGACLPLSGISMFTENMSAGKGFLAVSAARIGKGDPFKAFFACLIFAFADAVSVGLQSFNIPSQLVLMTPYIATVVVMCLTNLDQLKKNAV